MKLSRQEGARIRAEICDAVWTSKIDGQTTKEIAVYHGCSEQFALKVLLSIVQGTSGDARFLPNPDRNDLPRVQDGRTFFHGVDEHYSTQSKRPFRYYWVMD